MQAEIARGIMPMPHMNAKDEKVQCLLEISFIDAVVSRKAGFNPPESAVLLSE